MTEAGPRFALGIDFGGTSLKIGLVDSHGEIVAHESVATREIDSPGEWLDLVEDGLERLKASAERPDITISGIGIGVPGFVDYQRGFIYQLTNVKGWDEVQLGEIVRQRFDLPAFVDNDVNVMAVGECTFGAGRLYEHAVFVTLGTGVGGALLIHNKLYRGAQSMAGELGHMSVDMNGTRSAHGVGCLEQYIGNRRLVERAVAAIEAGKESTIRDRVEDDLTAVTPKVISEAARDGDALGLEIFDFMAQCLATVFASVSYLLQPQAFIVGGGVAQSGAVLFDPLSERLRDRLSPVFADSVKVIPAELGNDAGMIGGGTLALMSS